MQTIGSLHEKGNLLNFYM